VPPRARGGIRVSTDHVFTKAALRWLERYLAEGAPRLRHLARIASELASREKDDGGRHDPLSLF
jgi:hypothetical protein